MGKSPRRAVSRRTAIQLAVGTSLAAAMSPRPSPARPTTSGRRFVRVEDLDLNLMRQEWGTPHKNRSVDGRPLRVAGVTYRHGIGTHAASYLNIDLFGNALRFKTLCGVNEAPQTGRVRFEVYVDGKRVCRSPVMTGSTPAYRLSAELRGAKSLLLVVEPATESINFDHADWISPVIEMVPRTEKMPRATMGYLRTSVPEIASGDPPYPEFHGPRVVGCSPGKNFLFAVPHTGAKPVIISASGLPESLTIDERGRINGRVDRAGEYRVKLKAANAHGSAERTLKILCDENMLAQTPAMGWNSWNAYGLDNSPERTMAAADAMVNSGLAAKGFMYINLDDGWQDGRSRDGTIRPADKFSDMKKLIDYVHERGLRFGLYSSPGPTTCGGHTGSFGHVRQDAETYARWGVDYLKYDWCSYGSKVPPHPDLEQYIKPYREMGEALRAADRDIYFSLCQYGMAHVWTWGGLPPVRGNSYRISGDINDSWDAVAGNGFRCDGPLFPFAGPGHWNDPDMLVVGYGTFENGPPHWTKLTPDEQVAHITLWCMLAAPLLLGCDLTRLDKFTTDLMTNTEVLAVDQDELGLQAQRVYRQESVQVWARPLFDETIAVAIFNVGLVPRKINIPSWNVTRPVVPAGRRPLLGRQPVRDIWRRKNLGNYSNFSVLMAPHSARMLKVGLPKPEIV